MQLNRRNKGDGLKLLHSLDDASIPLVMFDPQYRGVMDHLALGNEGARQGERLGLPQMPDDVIRAFAVQIARVLKPSGHVMMWVDKFILCNDPMDFYTDEVPEDGVNPLHTVDLITWDHGKFGMGFRTRRCGEYLWIAQKEPKRAKGVWTDHGIRDCWHEKVTNHDHVHRKPHELQKRLIMAVTKKGDTVVDPCAGSFSVLEAAADCGRNFLGCDLLGNVS